MGLDSMLYRNDSEVAYWRKANAIHGWFVENVQGGKDDCKRYPVGVKKIKRLLSMVEEVISTKDASILPPVSGFFFGSTEVDKYYWQDMEDTKEMLSKIIASHSVGDKYYYRASW